jgi:UDP-N-acetylglucosamine--N-acetylmuramyl-(pentapeptide) pyrophosphoryl-undecaprenol N-acetylglucosamine transferase
LSTEHNHIANQPSYRIILSGGGTGGHFYPALAIANRFRDLYPGAEILFVGAYGKIEMEKAPLAGYPIEGLHIGGFNRKNMMKNLLLPVKVIRSLIKARGIINRFRPDAVVGTGGYASFPLIYVASKRKIPSLIQEQNFFPGITNKYLARYVNTICTVSPGMERYFPAEKIVITGNPVRASLSVGGKATEDTYRSFGLDSSLKTLLVLGGSLGARTINRAVMSGLDLIANTTGVQVLWQTGRIYYENIQAELAGKVLPNIHFMPFIDRMDAAYSMADLVVSRSGAISISELAVLGKPVILVPSPNVAEDHQTKNALSLVKENAALMIGDNDAFEKLIPAALELINNEQYLRKLSANISLFSKPDATDTIVNEIVKLIKQ